MHAAAIDLPIWSALLAGLAYTALAFQLRSGRPGPARNRAHAQLFAGAVLSSAAWGWAGVLLGFDLAVNGVVELLDLLRYAFWFAFILSVLAPAPGERRPSSLALLAPGAAIVVVAGATLLAFGYSPSDRDRLAIFEALALPLLGLVLVEQLFRNVSDESRWNAKPLCLGLCVFLFFDVYRVFAGRSVRRPRRRRRQHPRGRSTPRLCRCSSCRRGAARDWIARLKVSRTAAFHSAALVLAGVYLLFVAAVGYYIRFFGGEWGPRCSWLAARRGHLALVGPCRVGRHAVATARAWSASTSSTTATTTARSGSASRRCCPRRARRRRWATLVIRGLADLVESPSGALWTREPGQTEYVQTARWNSPASSDREPIDSSLSQFLPTPAGSSTSRAIARAPSTTPDSRCRPGSQSRDTYWLAIPLIVGDELLGFVTLGPARTPIDVNWEVTDLLKTASRQAAGFLAQMLATEALLEARKFDAFNRMSAFVVHDLKNIVAQL